MPTPHPVAPSQQDSTPHRFGWVYVQYGLPCAAVWTVYLLAFWPGILTEDSIEQWTDMVSGAIRGYHSPLQTVMHWLLTRMWLSPAMIVIAQIITMSAAFAAVMLECVIRRARTWMLVATTLAFALFPANGFLVTTLWKDVPYSIACLWLAALTLRLARSENRLASLGNIGPMASPRFVTTGFQS